MALACPRKPEADAWDRQDEPEERDDDYTGSLSPGTALSRGRTASGAGRYVRGLSYGRIVLATRAGAGRERQGNGEGHTGEMAPLVVRWIETGQAPTVEELASLKTRRPGVNPETGGPWKAERV